MDLLAKSCPRQIKAEPFFPIPAQVVTDEGALLVFREFRSGESCPREILLRVSDHTLRRIADLIEKVAAARERRAKFLRRQS
jgi:hypothetical protein